jgi:hypothetical protein
MFEAVPKTSLWQSPYIWRARHMLDIEQVADRSVLLLKQPVAGTAGGCQRLD